MVDKVQVRIGRLFCAFLFVLCATKVAYCVLGMKPVATLFLPDRIFYLVCLVLFYVTSIWNHRLAKYMQILLIVVASMWSLYLSPGAPFFGLVMITIAIILAYCYDIYSKRIILRLVCSAIFLYLLFAFIPLYDSPRKYVISIEWVVFISVFIFVLWIIFKDSIERLQNLEKQNQERYMRIIEEATSVARDAIALCEKEKQKLESAKG